MRSLGWLVTCLVFGARPYRSQDSRATESYEAARECAIQDAISIVPRLRYEHQFVSGTMFITSGGEPGTASHVDLRNDLDLDATDAFIAGLDVAWGRHRLRVAYEPLSITGRSTLDDDVVFHGLAFPAGSRVKTDLDLTFLTAGYDYRIVGSSGFDLRIGAAAFVWSFDAALTDTATGSHTSRAFTHVLPELTLESTIDLGRHWYFSVRAAGGLLASDRYVIDTEAAIGVTPWKRTEIDLGYRYWDLHFHETTNEAAIMGSGPFLQVTFRF